MLHKIEHQELSKCTNTLELPGLTCPLLLKNPNSSKLGVRCPIGSIPQIVANRPQRVQAEKWESLKIMLNALNAIKYKTISPDTIEIICQKQALVALTPGEKLSSRNYGITRIFQINY
jgi:hypothetical protein